MRPFKDRRRANGEVQLALIAAVVTTLACCDALTSGTGGASCTFGPKPRFKVNPCCFLIGEHLEELQRADCALAHESNSR